MRTPASYVVWGTYRFSGIVPSVPPMLRRIPQARTVLGGVIFLLALLPWFVGSAGATSAHRTASGVGPTSPRPLSVHWLHSGPGVADATVYWLAPASSGGSTITSYDVATSGGSCSSSPRTGAKNWCTITALPAGATYTFSITATSSGATSAPATIVSSLRALGQSITFDPLPDLVYGASPFTLHATASSGLPVSYEAQGSCAVNGDVLSITGAGECSVIASQVGSGAFLAASPVAVFFTVAPATAVITVADETVVADGLPHGVSVSVAPATPGLLFAYCSGRDRATCVSSPPSTPGIYHVEVSLGTADYIAAPVSATLTIAPAPAVLPVSLGGKLPNTLPSQGTTHLTRSGVSVHTVTSGLAPGAAAIIGAVASEPLGRFQVPTGTSPLPWLQAVRPSSPNTTLVGVQPVNVTSMIDLARGGTLPFPSGGFPGPGKYEVLTLLTTGLVPHSTVSVVMHSAGVVLAQAEADPAGIATLTVPVATAWAGQTHSLYLAGTYLVAHATANASGQVAANVNVNRSLLSRITPGEPLFVVTSSGGTPMSGVAVSLPSVAAFDHFLVATDPLHLHHYQPTSTPKSTMGRLAGTAAALSTAAAGVALARTMSSVSGSHLNTIASKTDPSGSHHHASNRTAEVVHRGYGDDREHFGDHIGTWRLPGHQVIDRWSIVGPSRLASVSVLGAALTSDASYLRAPLGSAPVLLPVAGLALGAMAAQQTHGYPLPPHYGLFLAILILGLLDALAGLAAFTWVLLAGVSTGHLFSVHMTVTALTLGAIWCGLPVMITKIRPFVRDHPGEFHDWWLRSGDVIVGALFGGYLASKLVATLPIVANLHIPLTVHSADIGWIVVGVVAARYVFTTMIAFAYPRRLRDVHPGELPDQSFRWEISSLVARSIFVALILYTILGMSWMVVVITAIVTIGSFLKGRVLAREVGDWLYRVVPRNMGKVLAVSIVGTAATIALSSHSVPPFWQVALLLLTVALVSMVLDLLSGLSGRELPASWPTRMAGLMLVIATGLSLTGHLFHFA